MYLSKTGLGENRFENCHLKHSRRPHGVFQVAVFTFIFLLNLKDITTKFGWYMHRLHLKRTMDQILKRTCEANPAGENSSFIFTACVKSVPVYSYKLAHVVLHMSVKEFFETSVYGLLHWVEFSARNDISFCLWTPTLRQSIFKQKKMSLRAENSALWKMAL